MELAFLFPGQGTQRVGMGRPLAEAFSAAREIFEEIDDALEDNLTRLIFEGPEDQLIQTPNAQPAIFAVSMAVVEVLKREGGVDLSKDSNFVVGHSLGEYGALTAAGALTIRDAAITLRARGNAMQGADPGGNGAMTAIIGPEFSVVEEISNKATSATGDICALANDNAPGQVVLSGTIKAIEKAEELAKNLGARRTIRLDVSAAFHSPLMMPALEEMLPILKSVPLSKPVPPVVSNVTATAEQNPNKIRDLLAQQITSRVRWRESIKFLASKGIDGVVETGAGKVLSGLCKRIEPNLALNSVETPEDVEIFLSSR